MSREKRKLDIKSLKEKYEPLKDLEKGLSNRDVAVKYGIPRNTGYVHTVPDSETEHRRKCTG